MSNRMKDERMAEIELSRIKPGGSLFLCAAQRGELLQALKAERKYVTVILEAQIKLTVDLYFEGCAADTFDDRMRELRQALERA